MAVKCIAIGNRIMGDDSIGIKVLEELSPQLKDENMDLIIGETDIEYVVSRIQDGDYLFIIDAAYYQTEPGTITFTPMNQLTLQHHQVYSQHQPNFIHLLKAYGISVDGYIIRIEVEEIDFCLELSYTLQAKLPSICAKVHQFIINNAIFR